MGGVVGMLWVVGTVAPGICPNKDSNPFLGSVTVAIAVVAIIGRAVVQWLVAVVLVQ